MRKSTKKIVKRLEQYVGRKIIRIRGTYCIGDYSFTEEPVILKGFTSKGEMIIEFPEENILFAGKTDTLPIEFTDNLWISYQKALRANNNRLNQWKGRNVRRTCPTKRIGDRSYMCEHNFEKPVTLISASKHHVVIRHNDYGLVGQISVLGSDFADSSEWELAE